MLTPHVISALRGFYLSSPSPDTHRNTHINNHKHTHIHIHSHPHSYTHTHIHSYPISSCFSSPLCCLQCQILALTQKVEVYCFPNKGWIWLFCSLFTWLQFQDTNSCAKTHSRHNSLKLLIPNISDTSVRVPSLIPSHSNKKEVIFIHWLQLIDHHCLYLLSHLILKCSNKTALLSQVYKSRSEAQEGSRGSVWWGQYS